MFVRLPMLCGMRGGSMSVAGVAGVASMSGVSRMSGVNVVARVASFVSAVGVATVRESADGHDAKSHGASRQRDEIEVHDS